MDIGIQKALIQDLKKAVTINEKIDLIVLFLEYLSEHSVEVDGFINASAKNHESTKDAIGEMMVTIKFLVERSDEAISAITISSENITKTTNSVVDVSESLNKVYGHLNTIYNSLNSTHESFALTILNTVCCTTLWCIFLFILLFRR